MSTLAEFEDFTTPEIRKRVVDAVFRIWGSLSKEARKSIGAGVGTPNGFRKGKTLPTTV